MKAWIYTAGLIACLGGCDDQPSKDRPLAPTASALASAKPKTAAAMKYAIEAQGSKIEFMMEAPKEKIHGRVNDATDGEIYIDASDLSKSSAHVHVKIGGIELFQQVASNDGTFADEKKDDDQNKHVRQWLEIGPDAPADARERNEHLEFVIKEVKAEPNDVSKLTGNERKATLTVKGDFLLHGRMTEKTAKLEALFKYKGDKPESVTIKTLEPFAVGLEEHDVKPREAFGKFAKSTLELLAPKVAKEAQVSLEFSAKFAGEAKKEEMEAAKETPKVAPPKEEPSAGPDTKSATKPATSAAPK